jgi:hypothetical protein
MSRREKDLMWAADSLLHPADSGKVCDAHTLDAHATYMPVCACTDVQGE